MLSKSDGLRITDLKFFSIYISALSNQLYVVGEFNKNKSLSQKYFDVINVSSLVCVSRAVPTLYSADLSDFFEG